MREQEGNVRTITRPVDLVEPPAEGDWVLPADCNVGEDSE